MSARDLCTNLVEHARHYADMVPHTGTLAYLARGSGSVLEFGVRGGVSTWALLDGLPANGRLVSVDTDESVRYLVPGRIADDPRWTLVVGDSATVGLDGPFDLVFIDTTHTRAQTLAELRRADSLGALRIALHDVALDGVSAAIADFLSESSGSGWSYQVEASEWGLGVLVLR